jgi:type 1 glutamine amidotransferase
MREAMIVWGGWEGHEPETCAHIIKGILEEEGMKVRLETSTEVFADLSPNYDPVICRVSAS